ncbi:unnamed protein product, partial [Discosporangium mesarthrocarpum]
DVALFLPTATRPQDRSIYLAFHINCPHRYLSSESIDTFKEKDGKYPDFILGKIILIEQQVAEVCLG